MGGLTSHLINDHRTNIGSEIPSEKYAEYYNVLKRTDVKVLTCEFCGKDEMPHTTAMNKHIIGCPSNDSGCSAGLFCHICGKMFAQQKYLKDHLARHGKDQVSFKFMMKGVVSITEEQSGTYSLKSDFYI